MPINFIEATCQEVTNVTLFGLCDDPPPSISPAYIDYDTINKSGWIAEVENNRSVYVTFTAIDNCIEIKRLNGEDEIRCEGYLTYEATIIFVELKNRISRGWLSKARDQLLMTISLFDTSHGFAAYANKRAHVANLQRPFFENGFQNVIEEVKARSGFNLSVQSKIEIT